jgi:hypothetical protein
MTEFDKEKMLPALRKLVDAELKTEELNPSITVAFQFDDNERLTIPKREDINIACKNKLFHWHVNSIRALFRGDTIPPDLEHYPEEYVPFFAAIEQPIADFSNQPELALSDVDFKEIFSTMRRRPDGKRINLMHDLIWQVTVLALALYPTSQAEYNAVFMRLEKSARTFNTGYGSKNYLAYLHNEFM